MYAVRKSDRVIVLWIVSNKISQLMAETREERTLPEGNSRRIAGYQTQGWANNKLDRVREGARRDER